MMFISSMFLGTCGLHSCAPFGAYKSYCQGQFLPSGHLTIHYFAQFGQFMETDRH